MDKVTAVNYCLGLLGFLLLQGVLDADGRSIISPGNNIFNPKDTDAKNNILALLLHKSLVPVEKDDDPLGLELANKLAEIKELWVLREDMQLDSQVTANLAEGKYITRKRGEPCFWKYCV